MDQALMTDGQSDRSEALLRQSLIAAVPLWVERVLSYSEEERQARQKACAETVAYRGDVLLFGGRPGQAADAFNHLAEGVAILSVLAKGGVPVFGLVFDTDPETGKLTIREDPGYVIARRERRGDVLDKAGDRKTPKSRAKPQPVLHRDR